MNFPKPQSPELQDPKPNEGLNKLVREDIDSAVSEGLEKPEAPKEKPSRTAILEEQALKMEPGAAQEFCNNTIKLYKEGRVGRFGLQMAMLMMSLGKFKNVASGYTGAYPVMLEKMEVKPDEEQISKLENLQRDEKREEPDTNKLGKYTDQASARYVAYSAFGMEASKIHNSDTFLSMLMNAEDKEGAKKFGRVSKSTLESKGLTFGTVLLFRPKMTDTTNIVAFATGNSDEIKYYTPEKGLIVTNFKDEQMNLIAAVKPNALSEEVVEKKLSEEDINRQYQDAISHFAHLERNNRLSVPKDAMLETIDTLAFTLMELEKQVSGERLDKIREMMGKLQEWKIEVEDKA